MDSVIMMEGAFRMGNLVAIFLAVVSSSELIA